MLTVACSYLNWTEKNFWKTTPRKYIAIKNDYFEMENQKIKTIMQAINPQLEFNSEEQQEGVYADQVFF